MTALWLYCLLHLFLSPQVHQTQATHTAASFFKEPYTILDSSEWPLPSENLMERVYCSSESLGDVSEFKEQSFLFLRSTEGSAGPDDPSYLVGGTDASTLDSEAQSPAGLSVWNEDNEIDFFEVEKMNLPPQVPYSAFLLSASHTLEDPVVFHYVEPSVNDESFTFVFARGMKPFSTSKVVHNGFRYTLKSTGRYTPKESTSGPYFNEYSAASSSAPQQKGFLCNSINGNLFTGWNVGLITRYLDYDDVLVSSSPSPSVTISVSPTTTPSTSTTPSTTRTPCPSRSPFPTTCPPQCLLGSCQLDASGAVATADCLTYCFYEFFDPLSRCKSAAFDPYTCNNFIVVSGTLYDCRACGSSSLTPSSTASKSTTPTISTSSSVTTTPSASPSSSRTSSVTPSSSPLLFLQDDVRKAMIYRLAFRREDPADVSSETGISILDFQTMFQYDTAWRTLYLFLRRRWECTETRKFCCQGSAQGAPFEGFYCPDCSEAKEAQGDVCNPCTCTSPGCTNCSPDSWNEYPVIPSQNGCSCNQAYIDTYGNCPAPRNLLNEPPSNCKRRKTFFYNNYLINYNGGGACKYCTNTAAPSTSYTSDYEFFQEPAPVFPEPSSLFTTSGAVFSFQVKQVALQAGEPNSAADSVLFHSGCRSFTRVKAAGGHAQRPDNVLLYPDVNFSPYLEHGNNTELQTVHFGNGNWVYISQPVICEFADITGDGLKDVITTHYDPGDADFVFPTIVVYDLHKTDGELSLNSTLDPITETGPDAIRYTVERDNEKLVVETSKPLTSFQVTDVDGNGLADFVVLVESPQDTVFVWLSLIASGGGLEFERQQLFSVGSPFNLPLSLAACPGPPSASNPTPLDNLYIVDARNNLQVLESNVRVSEVEDTNPLDLNEQLCVVLCRSQPCLPYPYPRCVCSEEDSSTSRVVGSVLAGLENTCNQVKLEGEVLGVTISGAGERTTCARAAEGAVSDLSCLIQAPACRLNEALYGSSFFITGEAPTLITPNHLTCHLSPYGPQVLTLQSLPEDAECVFTVDTTPMSLNATFWQSSLQKGLVQGFPAGLTVEFADFAQFSNEFFTYVATENSTHTFTLDQLLSAFEDPFGEQQGEKARSILCQSLLKASFERWNCPFPWVISQNILEDEPYSEPWCELPNELELQGLGASLSCVENEEGFGIGTFTCSTRALSPLQFFCPNVPAGLLASILHAQIRAGEQFLAVQDSTLRADIEGLEDPESGFGFLYPLLSFCSEPEPSGPFFSLDPNPYNWSQGCLEPHTFLELGALSSENVSVLSCELSPERRAEASAFIKCPGSEVLCWDEGPGRQMCQVRHDKDSAPDLCPSPLLLPAYADWVAVDGPLVQWGPLEDEVTAQHLVCEAVQVSCESARLGREGVLSMAEPSVGQSKLFCEGSVPEYLLMNQCPYLTWSNSSSATLSEPTVLLAHTWECWLQSNQPVQKSGEDCLYTCWSSTLVHAQRLDSVAALQFMSDPCLLFSEGVCPNPKESIPVGALLSLEDTDRCLWNYTSAMIPTEGNSLPVLIDAGQPLPASPNHTAQFSCDGSGEEGSSGSVTCSETAIRGLYQCVYLGLWSCIVPLDLSDAVISRCAALDQYCTVARTGTLWRRTAALSLVQAESTGVLPVRPNLKSTFKTLDRSAVALAERRDAKDFAWLCPLSAPWWCPNSWCLNSLSVAQQVAGNCVSVTGEFEVIPGTIEIPCRSSSTGSLQSVVCTSVIHNASVVSAEPGGYDFHCVRASSVDSSPTTLSRVECTLSWSAVLAVVAENEQTNSCSEFEFFCLHQTDLLGAGGICGSANVSFPPGAYCSFDTKNNATTSVAWVPANAQDFWCEEEDVSASSGLVLIEEAGGWRIDLVCGDTAFVCRSTNSDACSEFSCRSACSESTEERFDCFNTRSVVLFEPDGAEEGCSGLSLEQFLSRQTMSSAQACESLFDKCQLSCAFLDEEDGEKTLLPADDTYCNGKIRPQEIFLCDQQQIVCELSSRQEMSGAESVVWSCRNANEDATLAMDCLVERKFLDTSKNICRTLSQRCRFDIQCRQGWRRDILAAPFCTLPPIHGVGQRGGECDCSVHWSPDIYTLNIIPADLLDVQCYENSLPHYLLGGDVPPLDQACSESQARSIIYTQIFATHFGTDQVNVQTTSNAGLSCRARGYWSVEEFFLDVLAEILPARDDRLRLLLHFLRNTDPFVVTLPEAEEVLFQALAEFLRQPGGLFYTEQPDSDLAGQNIYVQELILPGTLEIEQVGIAEAVLSPWRRHWCLEAVGAEPAAGIGNLAFLDELINVRPVCSVRPGTFLPLCTVECPAGLYKLDFGNGAQGCTDLTSEGVFVASSSCLLGARSPYTANRYSDDTSCPPNLFSEWTRWPLPLQAGSNFLDESLQLKEMCSDRSECHGVALYDAGVYFLRRKANFPSEVLDESTSIRNGRRHDLSSNQAYFLHPTKVNSEFGKEGSYLVRADDVWQKVYADRTLFSPLSSSGSLTQTFTIDRQAGHKFCQEFVFDWSTPFLLSDRPRPGNLFNIPRLFELPRALVRQFVTLTWTAQHVQLVAQATTIPVTDVGALYAAQPYTVTATQMEALFNETVLGALDNFSTSSATFNAAQWQSLYTPFIQIYDRWKSSTSWQNLLFNLFELQNDIGFTTSYLHVQLDPLLRRLYALQRHEQDLQETFRSRYASKDTETVSEDDSVANIFAISSQFSINELEIPCYLQQGEDRNEGECASLFSFVENEINPCREFSSGELIDGTVFGSNNESVSEATPSCFERRLGSSDSFIWEEIMLQRRQEVQFRESDRSPQRLGSSQLHPGETFVWNYAAVRELVPIFDTDQMDLEITLDKSLIQIKHAGASEEKTTVQKEVPFYEISGFESTEGKPNPVLSLQFFRVQDFVAYHTWVLWKTVLSRAYAGYNSLPVSLQTCSDRHYPLWKFTPDGEEECVEPLCPLPLQPDIDWFALEFEENGLDPLSPVTQDSVPFYPNPPRHSLPRQTDTGFPCSLQGYCDSSEDGTEQTSVAGKCRCEQDFQAFESMLPSKLFVDAEGNRRAFSSLQSDNCELDTRGTCRVPQLGEVTSLCGSRGECVVDFEGGFQKATCECGEFPRIPLVTPDSAEASSSNLQSLVKLGFVLTDKCSALDDDQELFCPNEESLMFEGNGFSTPPTRYPEQCIIPPSGCVFNSRAWQFQFQRNSRKSYSRQESFGCTLPRRNARGISDGQCVRGTDYFCQCNQGKYGPYCEHMTIEGRCYAPPSPALDGGSDLPVQGSTACLWNSHLHQFERLQSSNLPVDTGYDEELYPAFQCGGLACSGNGQCVHEEMNQTNSVRDELGPVRDFSYSYTWGELMEFSPAFRAQAEAEFKANNTLFAQAYNQYCQCREGFAGTFCEQRVCTNPSCVSAYGEWCKNQDQLDRDLACHCPIDSNGGDCWRFSRDQTCVCDNGQIKYCDEDPNAELTFSVTGSGLPTIASCTCKQGYLLSLYGRCIPNPLLS